MTTLERCWGIFRPDIRAAVAAAYEQSMRFSEHTWGLANQHYIKQPYGKAWDELWSQGLPPQYKLMEESWKEKAGCVDDVQRLVAGPYCRCDVDAWPTTSTCRAGGSWSTTRCRGRATARSR